VEDVELYPAGAGTGEQSTAGVLEVFIKESKTDGWRKGIKLRVFANGSPTCPVAAMARWLRLRGADEPRSPLFVMADGSYLTRERFQRLLKRCIELAGYSSAHYNTHSCRIGGATSLACAGQSAETIQMLGRWSSDCYTRYLRMDDSRRRRISKAMSEVVSTDIEDSKVTGEVDSLDRWSGVEH
jgi:site-specific recombinase XerD